MVGPKTHENIYVNGKGKCMEVELSALLENYDRTTDQRTKIGIYIGSQKSEYENLAF